MNEHSDGSGLSLRELVMEIRMDVKALDEKIDKIDRQGSIGTRELLKDHETRIRSLESTDRWRYGIPPAFLAGLGGLITSLLGMKNP